MSSTQTVKQEVPTGAYTVDPVHSTIHFAVVHNGVSTFRSGFRAYEAKLEGGEQPQLTGSVEVGSVDIEEEMLKGHLLSPDFFDAERYPQLKFSSTAFEVAEDGALTLRGQLEIHGETHEVEASGRFGQLGTDLGGKARVGLSLEASVDRRSFGLDWQAELPSGGEVLDYTVDIAVDLELVKEGE
ncbi:MAG TPA: YceI family protein [Solirubrobacterales bacterium]|jgi:polyisoprenoid-binding protein YceI|nr:YceI family protein [Solirubrobacterales bacterium]